MPSQHARFNSVFTMPLQRGTISRQIALSVTRQGYGSHRNRRMQTVTNESTEPALSFEQELEREVQRLRELTQQPINRFLDGVARFVVRSVRVAIGAAMGIGATILIRPGIPNIGDTPLGSLILSDVAKALLYGLLWILAIYIACTIAFGQTATGNSDDLHQRAFRIVEDRRPPVFYRVITPRNSAAAKKWGASPMQRVHAKLFELAQQSGGTVSNADVRKVCLAEGAQDRYIWLINQAKYSLMLIPAAGKE